MSSSLLQLSCLPSQVPSGNNEEHHHDIGANPQPSHQEDDPSRCLRVLVTLDGRAVGAVSVFGADEDACPRDSSGHCVRASS